MRLQTIKVDVGTNPMVTLRIGVGFSDPKVDLAEVNFRWVWEYPTKILLGLAAMWQFNHQGSRVSGLCFIFPPYQNNLKGLT